MLKALALLLLCGFLPISHGEAENLLSVAQVDKAVLENLLSNVLAKDDLLQGLTGGVSKDVLGGLSGGQVGGPLGDVLGGQDGGVLGGVLGGQGGGLLDGVLGGQGGGVLGGVLGGQGGGLLDGVLGGQGGGLLDGVLGGQGGGVLGGVLGGQGGGVLGGVLGGQGGGLLDGVLGGQGGRLLDGVLGGQGGGVLGGVLGGQGGGLLDGVLGGQGGGLLDGVLGGQGGGVLGGVLGGQGGGLLDGVLGGQGGELLDGVLGGQGGGVLGGVLGGQGGGVLDGVLGGKRGGLLGGVLGGPNGGLLGGVLGHEGLLGLKLVDIILPKVTLKLYPVGLGLNIYTKIVLKGNTILGGPLTLLVEVNITANSRLVLDKMGNPKLLLENCRTNLGGIRILSGLLPMSLDNVLSVLLNKLIPGLLCPVADVVLNLLNTILATVNSVRPFGILGNLHYTLAGLPLFKDQHIGLNLNLMMTDRKGQPVDFPGAQNTSLPLPPAMDRTSQLMLPRDLLSSLLQMLIWKGAFDADLTGLALFGSVPMTTLALQTVLPELSQLGAENLPLVVKIRVRGLPEVSLQNGKAMIQLGADLQVLSRSNSSLTPLFTVNTNISLSGSFSVTRTKLGISLALESVSLRVADVGSFDENALKNWITNILQIGYLPLINVGLNIGIPLPNIFNLNFANGVVKTLDEMLMISKTPK